MTLRVKPTKVAQRRYELVSRAIGRLRDGAHFAISAEDGLGGGVIVKVGNGEEAWLLPYGALIKAVEEARRG